MTNIEIYVINFVNYIWPLYMYSVHGDNHFSLTTLIFFGLLIPSIESFIHKPLTTYFRINSLTGLCAWRMILLPEHLFFPFCAQQFFSRYAHCAQFHGKATYQTSEKVDHVSFYKSKTSYRYVTGLIVHAGIPPATFDRSSPLFCHLQQ